MWPLLQIKKKNYEKRSKFVPKFVQFKAYYFNLELSIFVKARFFLDLGLSC